MKILNLGCPQKFYYKTCKILSYSCFLCNCKYNIIKLNTGSIPFSNRKYKGRKKKLATKEKNAASAKTNSREKLKSE